MAIVRDGRQIAVGGRGVLSLANGGSATPESALPHSGLARTRNKNNAWLGSAYELVIMVVSSGVFANERGASSTFLGLLTKQDVLDDL